MFQLKEKRVVVTGTASGIGLAIAEIFAAHEAAVVVLDLDSDKVALKGGASGDYNEGKQAERW
ncbi:MAG: 3-oxoacyl-(acyl-carrier-protein) reductase [Edaphobacter sp.]|nr:3-oxoacyl-(acyl-carrier-protein) reductase [Edaphobacter sp.]